LKIEGRKKEIMEVIDSYTRKHGEPPTIAEIATMTFTAASSTIHQHLVPLVENGYLTQQKNIRRSLRVTDKYREHMEKESPGYLEKYQLETFIKLVNQLQEHPLTSQVCRAYEYGSLESKCLVIGLNKTDKFNKILTYELGPAESEIMFN